MKVLYYMWLDLPKGTRTEIHFIPMHETEVHYFAMYGQVCFYQLHSYKAVEPRGCATSLLLPLRSINRIPWGTRLLVMAILADPVACVCQCHIQYWTDNTALRILVNGFDFHLPPSLLLCPPSIDTIRDIYYSLIKIQWYSARQWN